MSLTKGDRNSIKRLNSHWLGWTQIASWTMVCLILAISIGCGGYGSVSDRAYEYSTATYSACLAKSTERLDRIEEMLSAEGTESTMEPHEVVWIEKIIDEARSGNWESAAKSARRMMEDQVEY